MPPFQMFTKDFAKEIFAGKKKLLKLQEVKFVNIVRYDELSVKGLYDKFLSLDGMHQYFPSKFAKGRQCDREYMFNVANTLHQDIVKELVEHALNQRHAVESINLKDEAILLSEHWKEELKSLPLVAHVSDLSESNCFFRKKEKWWICSSRSPRSPSSTRRENHLQLLMYSRRERSKKK